MGKYNLIKFWKFKKQRISPAKKQLILAAKKQWISAVSAEIRCWPDFFSICENLNPIVHHQDKDKHNNYDHNNHNDYDNIDYKDENNNRIQNNIDKFIKTTIPQLIFGARIKCYTY